MLCSYHERLRGAGVASCGSRSRSKRASAGQKFVVRCNSEIAGSRIVEERPAKGATAARRTAEILASTLNVTATVYGTDAEGEFVYGVYEVAEGAATASSPLIRQLFAESAAASLALKDQLLANIPEDTIKGFASMAASLGYIVAQHKQIKRAAAPQISYSTLFRIFCGAGDPSIISLLSDDATIAILTQHAWRPEIKSVWSKKIRCMLGPCVADTRPDRVRSFQFASLALCRDQFASHTGVQKIEWDLENEAKHDGLVPDGQGDFEYEPTIESDDVEWEAVDEP
jgi:hypothetical protein